MVKLILIFSPHNSEETSFENVQLKKIPILSGKFLLLIDSHFNPGIYLQPDEGKTIVLAPTKYELDRRSVR